MKNLTEADDGIGFPPLARIKSPDNDLPAGIETAFARVWGGFCCYVETDGRDIAVSFNEGACVLRYRLEELSEECCNPLAGLVAGVIEEMGQLAYRAGRQDARNAMLNAV